MADGQDEGDGGHHGEGGAQRAEGQPCRPLPYNLPSGHPVLPPHPGEVRERARGGEGAGGCGPVAGRRRHGRVDRRGRAFEPGTSPFREDQSPDQPLPGRADGLHEEDQRPEGGSEVRGARTRGSAGWGPARPLAAAILLRRLSGGQQEEAGVLLQAPRGGCKDHGVPAGVLPSHPRLPQLDLHGEGTARGRGRGGR